MSVKIIVVVAASFGIIRVLCVSAVIAAGIYSIKRRQGVSHVDVKTVWLAYIGSLFNAFTGSL